VTLRQNQARPRFAGGTAFLVEMDTSRADHCRERGDPNGANNAKDVEGALSQAVEVLRKRVDQFGVAEPVIQPMGGNQIFWIQFAGLSEADKESAATKHPKGRVLEFRIVNENSDEILANNEPIPPATSCSSTSSRRKMASRHRRSRHREEKAEPGLSGDIVKSAQMGRGNLGEPIIQFGLTDAAGRRFGDVTRNNIGRRLAIVLDGQLYSRAAH